MPGSGLMRPAGRLERSVVMATMTVAVALVFMILAVGFPSPRYQFCKPQPSVSIGGRDYSACQVPLDWSGAGVRLLSGGLEVAQTAYHGFFFVLVAFATWGGCIDLNFTGYEPSGASYSFILDVSPPNCETPGYPHVLSPDRLFGGAWYGNDTATVLVQDP